MRPSDIYIQRVLEYVEKKRKEGRSIKEIIAPTRMEHITNGFPLKVGPRSSSGIILEEDTFIELGNPSTASCAFVLFTDEVSFVCDGRITLVGPDISEASERKLPFAQVITVASANEYSDHHYTLVERTQYVSDQIEGYMIRAVPQRMWSRISTEAARKGFSFEVLGKALQAIYREKLPFVDAIEVLFVVSSREDVEELYAMGSEARKITRQIKEIKKKEYTPEDVCHECDFEKVCDEIKKLLQMRGILNPEVCIR